MSETQDPPSGDPMAGLAARVGRIGRELGDLKRTVDGFDERIGDVARLRSQVASLATVVADLAQDAGADGRSVELASWWPDVEPGEKRTTALRLLGKWVDDVIRARHPDAYRDLQPCWYWHADVVDELTALRAAWLAAYQESESSPTAAIEWHDRWLPACMARCKTAMKARACKGGHQNPPKTEAFYDSVDFKKFTES